MSLNDPLRVKADALADTLRALFADGKGILAMDESNATCNQRFEALGIAPTQDNRRDWRELLIRARGLADSIGGVILYDETIRQCGHDGTPMVELLKQAGVLIGIKVDSGAHDLAGHPGERITEGLDGLRERLGGYADMGARFAKWRAVIAIGGNIPTQTCIRANAQALARYAALCQEAGLLPMVEPEVLMQGDHSIGLCATVTETVLRSVFDELHRHRVALEAIVLKPNMVLAGLNCPVQPTVDQVAEATVQCLRFTVPPAVPAIAFLSGGQQPELATEHLNAMNARFGSLAPWTLSFSFARAIQRPALQTWRGEADNVHAAQQALIRRAQLDRLARLGQYRAELEPL